MVECAGLENQSPCKRTAGSNPAPSASATFPPAGRAAPGEGPKRPADRASAARSSGRPGRMAAVSAESSSNGRGSELPGDPRLSPATRAEMGWLNTAIVEVIRRGARTQRAPNLFTTLARHRRLFRGWLRFAGALMPGGSLARRDTELVILRVAHNSGCEYEWRHHQRLGRRAGLSDAEIERVTGGWRLGLDEPGSTAPALRRLPA